MSVNFEDLLTIEQKHSIVSQKIQQLAIEGYQLKINRSVLEKSENVEQELALIDENIKIVENAITVYTEELDKLN